MGSAKAPAIAKTAAAAVRQVNTRFNIFMVPPGFCLFIALQRSPSPEGLGGDTAYTTLLASSAQARRRTTHFTYVTKRMEQQVEGREIRPADTRVEWLATSHIEGMPGASAHIASLEALLQNVPETSWGSVGARSGDT